LGVETAFGVSAEAAAFTAKDNFLLDTDSIERQITPGTRLLVVNDL
jgi:aspartate/methionine/tyrosine aminotransferase